ncbi:MAG TPA: MATE family efflux transporter, partial [Holophaga sp.]|nr:MATE family efflux transporter [Holophaga sp.]
GEMSGYSREFFKRFLKPVMPVIANEVFWSMGVSLYTFFYGMQGVYATTTAQIMEVMSNLFFSVLIGLGSACGVMIGNRIGAGEERVARIYAARSVLFGACTGLLVGGGLALCSPLFLAFFHVSPGIHAACRAAAYVYAGTMFLRSINMIMVVGVCRSAGDTVFAALIDVLSPWLIGIPMAALGVMVLHWPIYLVILLVSLEEAVKAVFGVWRLLSGRWLNNLVRDLHGGEVDQDPEDQSSICSEPLTR